MNTETLTKTITEILKQYPVQKAAIFGSYARNEQTPTSDIDLVVDFDEGIITEFFDLYDELEETFGVKVDILTSWSINRAEPEDRFMANVKKDLRWFYAR
ncbi:MAG: nucleotidyltransferase family protein [Defluviitaleaceae bacterium]|nr:nucleotidyltransferase family protein [Defluviitaleaceae bacterium]